MTEEMREGEKKEITKELIFLCLKTILSSEHFGVDIEDIKPEMDLLSDTNLSMVNGKLSVHDFFYYIDLIFADGNEIFDDLDAFKEVFTIGNLVELLFEKKFSKINVARLPVRSEHGVKKIPEELLGFAKKKA